MRRGPGREIAPQSLTAFGLGVVLALISHGRLLAQVPAEWRIPDETIEVSFTPGTRGRTFAFLDQGMAIEVPVEFSMIQRSEVRLEAKLPEPGRFEVELANPKARVKLEGVESGESRGRARVVAKVRPLSPAELMDQVKQTVAKLREPARKEAEQEAGQLSREELRAYLGKRGVPRPEKEDELRKVYINSRTLEKSTAPLRERLLALAAKRPGWFSTEEVERWKQADAGELLGYCYESLALEMADDHLQACGLAYDPNNRALKGGLLAMLEEAHVLMSGKLAEGQRLKNALSSSHRTQLAEGLAVRLKCRFYPQVDSADANAEWYNAQRVVCRASGIAAIRAEGSLDPKGGDRVDWWILDRFQPGSSVLKTSDDASVRFDPPFARDGRALLRVVARGDQPVRYWFEVEGAGKSGPQVLLHESPSNAAAKFPF